MASKDVEVAPRSAMEEFQAAMAAEGMGLPGLEDFSKEDLTIPVIQIEHETGLFVDKLTGEKFPEIDGVLLGLLKSRIMWPPQQNAVGQKPAPMCRSREAITGKPGDNFPWADFKKGTEKNKEWSPEPLSAETIACSTCYFAQWGSDPKNDSPRCTMQYVFPIMGKRGDEYHLQGLLTVQRTGIKPANAYMSGFVRDGMSLFMHHTTLTLRVQQSGTVKFSVPTFARGEATPADMDLWRSWAETYSGIKQQLQGRDLGDSLTTPAKAADEAAF